MKIGNFEISDNNKCFIVAELSANHNNNFETCIKSIDAAKNAGANAIKLQTFKAKSITLNCNNKYFKISGGTIWDGKLLYDLYEQAAMPWEWQEKLIKHAKSIGLECFSSPFDKEAIDFLESLNVKAYKIASFEIHDIPLIKYAASKGKPIIISTGIATLGDIEEAVNACLSENNHQIILLKCTSSYPAPLNEVNLKSIPSLKRAFNVQVGLSDHTLGNTAAISAVTLGSKFIEKHFILDKNLNTPDASFSLNPEEFKNLCDDIRNTELALGKENYIISEETLKNRKYGRSLFVSESINKGEKFTIENIKSVRPGDGLAPKYLEYILGKKARTNIEFGTPLSWDLIEND